MNDLQVIKTAFERNEKVLKKQPSLAQKTGKVSVRSSKGLACEVESDPWKFRMDMPPQVGGHQSAPTPGIYEAAALGGCITIMVRMWAAKLDVPIFAIETEVEFEADKRYLFDLGGVPPRWNSIKYNIIVESPASEAEVMKVLDIAHRQSHVRGDLEHSFEVERSVEIRKSANSQYTHH